MVTIDQVKNFTIGTVATVYDSVAVSILLSTGHGNRFPDPDLGEYNLVYWNTTDYNMPHEDPEVEIIRVTGKSGDTLTIERGQEDTIASVKNRSGKTYMLALVATAKTIDDIRDAFDTKQDYSDELTAIALITSGNGYLKRSALGIWSLDVGGSVSVEDVQDIVGSLIQNGTGISWNYDDVANTLTPTVNLSAFTTDDLPEGATNLYYTDSRVESYINSQKGAVNGLATLGADQKIPTSQLPALAITDTFVVLDQTEMLALTAETGDIAIRVDLNKSFILSADDPTILGNWQELLTPTDSVLSVNGQTGAVTLTTSHIGEGSNLYFTNARARSAISSTATGLDYDNSTGVFSATSGYGIPTTAKQTQWDTAYGWGNHASAGYLTSISGLTHSTLGGLTTGDAGHTQFALLAGRTGGQSLIGGSAVTDILSLIGTSGNGTLTSPAVQVKVGNNGATTAITVLNNGNVGIGTTTPAAKLDVNGSLVVNGAAAASNRQISLNHATQAALSYQVGGVEKWVTYADSSNNYAIQQGGVGDRLVINSSGDIGMGTSTPSAALNIVKTNLNSQLRIESITGGNVGIQMVKPTASSYNTIGFYTGSTRNYIIEHDNNGLFNIGRSGQTDLIINSSGNVGIGTTTPNTTLHVLSANQNAATFQSTGSNTAAITLTSTDRSTSIFNGTTGSNYIRVNGGYEVLSTGSGTSNNSLKFYNSNAATLYATLGVNSNDDLVLSQNNPSKYILLNGGNVGIGTTSPSARLHIISTTEQFRAGYDASIYWNATTAVTTGITTFNAVGGTTPSFVFSDPVSATTLKVTTVGGYISSDGSTGATGTFTTTDLKTVTVKDGLVTAIV